MHRTFSEDIALVVRKWKVLLMILSEKKKENLSREKNDKKKDGELFDRFKVEYKNFVLPMKYSLKMIRILQ